MQFKLYKFQVKNLDEWVTQFGNNNKPLMVWLNPEQFFMWEHQLDGNRRLVPVEGASTILKIENAIIKDEYAYKYDDHRNTLNKLDFIRGCRKVNEQLRPLVADQHSDNWSVVYYVNGIRNSSNYVSEIDARNLYNRLCKILPDPSILPIVGKAYRIYLKCNNKIVQEECHI